MPIPRWPRCPDWARCAGPSRVHSVDAYASQPAGNLVIINSRTFDLVGGLAGPDGQVTLESCRNWALRANHRGLRHIWRVSEAAGPESRGDSALLWPPAASDLADAADESSGLARLRRINSAAQPMTIAGGGHLAGAPSDRRPGCARELARGTFRSA